MNQFIPVKPDVKAARAESSRRARQAARDILLLGSSAVLSPEAGERLSVICEGAVDWKYLLELSESHNITPLIAHSFISSGLIERIPQPHRDRLSTNYKNNLYKNIILSDELLKVLSAFSRHNIPTISLKGTILAEQLYGNPGLRTVKDIDIMVRIENLAPARALLQELGYEQLPPEETWEHPFHEAPFTRRGQFPFVIELHWELENPKLVTIPYDKIWERARQLTVQGVAAAVMSPEDTLLYLANNYSKQTEDILKCLCDIRTLLDRYRSGLDWDYIIASACSWKIETAVFFALKRCKDVFAMPVADSVLNALKPGKSRLRLLNFLVDQEYLIYAVKGDKIKGETLNLFYGLSMEHMSQTLMVLSRFRGTKKKWAWPRTVLWVTMVFITAVMRNLFKTRKRR